MRFSYTRQKQRKEEYIWKVFDREPEALREGKDGTDGRWSWSFLCEGLCDACMNGYG